MPTKPPFLPAGITRALVWTALLATGACTGWGLLTTTFMLYDDEGYVLESLRGWMAHGQLYDVIYTQYGPFFYVYHEALARLTGLAFHNDSARLVTLAHWLGAGAAAAFIAGRLAGSTRALVATAALTFTYTWVMISEPSHPGSLLSLLSALLAVAGVAGLTRAPTRVPVVFLGLIGGAMALTKINVGAFAVIAAATWLLAHAAPPRWQRAGVVLAAFAAVAVPFLLMRPHFDQAWVVRYALTVACGALALVIPWTRPASGAAITPRQLVAFAVAGIALTLGVVIWMAVRDTPPAALWRGGVLQPLQHPGVYQVPVQWLPGASLLALGSLGLALTHHLRPLPVVVAWIRLAVAGVLAAGVLWPGFPVSFGRMGLVLVVPLAWVFVPPLRPPVAGSFTPARSWLAWVFVWQSLHAFPVAGSQLNWGTFLALPLVIVGVAETALFLRGAVSPGHARGWRWFGVAAVLVAFVPIVELATRGLVRHRESVSLDLPGARHLRPPNDLSLTLRTLALNASVSTTTLMTYPGMYSFNQWTGRPTPSLANATHWWSLLDDAQQAAIATQLLADPSAGLIVQRLVVDFLRCSGFPPAGPLVDLLESEFHCVLRLESYELWLRRGRTVPLLNVGHVAPADHDQQREVLLTVPALRSPPAAVSIRLPDPAGTVLGHFPRATMPLWEEDALAAPAGLAGLIRVRLTLPASTFPFSLGLVALTLDDDAGRPLATVRLVNTAAPPIPD